MKITKENIQRLEDGYLGTIIEKVYGQPNILNNCSKNDGIIKVKAPQDQAPTIHTVDGFCNAYKGRNLQIL